MKALLSLALLIFGAIQYYSFCGSNKKVVMIIGASCSGKSSLSKELLKNLGYKWKFIELDAIEDEFKLKKLDFTNADLINAIVYRSNIHLANDYNVLIDTNIYDPQLLTINSPLKKRIFVYCPLPVLLERNKNRDIKLNRDSKRSRNAYDYVEHTYKNFCFFSEYDLLVDSSVQNVCDSCQYIMKYLKNID